MALAFLNIIFTGMGQFFLLAFIIIYHRIAYFSNLPWIITVSDSSFDSAPTCSCTASPLSPFIPCTIYRLRSLFVYWYTLSFSTPLQKWNNDSLRILSTTKPPQCIYRRSGVLKQIYSSTESELSYLVVITRSTLGSW